MRRTYLPILLLTMAALPSVAQRARAEPHTATAGDAEGPAPDLLILGGGNVELAFRRSQSNDTAATDGAGDASVDSAADSGAGKRTTLTGESYLEIEKHGFYAGVFGSVSNESVNNEVDLYLGFRRDLSSGLGYDIGYRRYTYPNDGQDCCGQATLGLSLPFGEAVSLGLHVAYDPENSVFDGVVSAEYAPSDTWTLSGSYGTYEQSDATSDTEWDVGATYALSDKVGLDVRYNDSNTEPANIGLSVVFDTTLLRR